MEVRIGIYNVVVNLHLRESFLRVRAELMGRERVIGPPLQRKLRDTAISSLNLGDPRLFSWWTSPLQRGRANFELFEEKAEPVFIKVSDHRWRNSRYRCTCYWLDLYARLFNLEMSNVSQPWVSVAISHSLLFSLLYMNCVPSMFAGLLQFEE